MSKRYPPDRQLFQSPWPWLGLALLVGLFYLLVSARGFGYLGFPLDDAWIHQTYARNLAGSGQLAFTPGVTSAGSTAPLWSLLLSLGYLLRLPYLAWAYGLGLAGLGLAGWTAARLGWRLFPQHGRVGLLAGLFCLFEWHLVWAAVSGMETILFVWLSLLLVERYLAGEGPPDPPKGGEIEGPPEGNGIKLSPSGPPKGNGINLSKCHSEAKRGIPAVMLKTIRSRAKFLPVTGAFIRRLQGFLLPLRSSRNDITSTIGLGLLGGLLVLTRPEGVLLVGLVGLDMAFRRPGRPALLRRWVGLGLGAGLLLLPYVLFHLWATGLPFPNTFYAKQAEYRAILASFPLWWRLFGSFGPPVETVQGVFRVIFIGAQVLLLPGLALAAWLTWRERRSELVLIWLWWAGYLLLYGLRLPVTYQHGRYQIPAIAWVILLGVWGTARLLALLPRRRLLWRAAGQALVLSLALLVLAFTGVGARTYGRDVRIIESEMVAAARWLDQHAAPDALIAAHDIGAIGYFTQRPLLDLAGLITPEVIPFIRDEAGLLAFIQARRADYLVTFPSWYPAMTGQAALQPVYSTGAPWAPAAGGDNMTVYRLKY